MSRVTQQKEEKNQSVALLHALLFTRGIGNKFASLFSADISRRLVPKDYEADYTRP